MCSALNILGPLRFPYTPGGVPVGSYNGLVQAATGLSSALRPNLLTFLSKARRAPVDSLAYARRLANFAYQG